jgi:hypothetical protein
MVMSYRLGRAAGVRSERLRASWEGQDRQARIMARIDQYGLEGIQEALDEEGAGASWN